MTHRNTTSTSDKSGVNRLLATLPPRERQRIVKSLEPVAFRSGEWLDLEARAPRYAYFPQTGVLSLLRPMRDGTNVEVGTVGNEGMAGIGLVLEAVHGHVRVLCQVPCEALRINAQAFQEVIARTGVFQTLLHRYAQWLMIHFMQQIACNRLHFVERRCAAWLLLTHDRVPGDTFELKHEFLALMLGVRRASVTVVARAFQDAGLICYSRGHVSILNRGGLEQASCECYDVVTRAYRDVVKAH